MKTRKNKNTRRKKYIKKTLYSRRKTRKTRNTRNTRNTRKTRITRKKEGGGGVIDKLNKWNKKRNILKKLRDDIQKKIRDINNNYYFPMKKLRIKMANDRYRWSQDPLYFRYDPDDVKKLKDLKRNAQAMERNIDCLEEYEEIIKKLDNKLDYELVTYDNILKLCESENSEEELYIYLQDVQNKKMKPIDSSELPVNDDHGDHGDDGDDEPGSKYSGDSLPSSLPK